MHSMQKALFFILTLLLLAEPAVTLSDAKAASSCIPTRPDADGPFYRAGAPERTRVGEGYILRGAVLSATDCKPIPGAKIELWLNGPNGRYGDQWRATLYADQNGRYRFESHLPVPYGSRPPHIHIIVNGPEHAELITQHYPEQSVTSSIFDLVLLPDK